MVADVAPRRIVGWGEIPRGLRAGAERAANRDPPLLALADLAIQGGEVPSRGDLTPELPGEPGRRRVAGQVGLLVRIGREVAELVWVGW